MRNLMLVSVVIFAGALLLLVPALGNHGLWASLMVLNTARGVSMAIYYGRAEAAAR
jgi:MATE family multidrug resistance protein